MYYCILLNSARQNTISVLFSEGKSVDELFPYFFAFAKKIYPQFEFQKDLQLISDLTQPANW